MGLAASQARLLSLTSRIQDVEFEAQQVQYAKMRLALMEDEVSKKYMDALDAETLTMPGANGSRIKASFNNLCGVGSLNYNTGNAHYIFRDKNDRVIVPNDIYTGYLNYGGSDPYEFAFTMMGIDINSEDYTSNLSALESNESLKDATEARKTIFKKDGQLYKLCESVLKDKLFSGNKTWNDLSEEDKKNELESLMNNVYASLNNDTDLKKHLGDDIYDRKVGTESVEDIIESLRSSKQEYQSKLFKTAGGAELIYNAYNKLNADNTDFDQNLFNYYVRWGQIIENEGGIMGDTLLGCTNASDYENDIESNPELLNENIMYGYISIDIIYDNRRTGGISYEPTSTSTDTYLSMDKTTTVDSTAAKKAEAEYNKKLKEINRIDKNYDLSLNRLETERTALTTEYDSVKKVIQDNIERTFGIFS